MVRLLPTGATAILLFVCMLSLFSTNCPNIIVLHSANTSELQATKKPHNYHKIAVWQKDDRIRKSPLKFCVYHYNELEGDCQAAIITELCRREKLYLSTCLLIHIKVHRSKSPASLVKKWCGTFPITFILAISSLPVIVLQTSDEVHSDTSMPHLKDRLVAQTIHYD